MIAAVLPINKLEKNNRTMRIKSSIKPAKQYHIFQKGDTLQSIAQRYYGDAAGEYEIKLIYAANPILAEIPVNQLQPGEKIVIPERLL
jgi:nucleoid-associated protein YgaU